MSATITPRRSTPSLVTPPRYNEPSKTWFVTVQAIDRQMRFLPTKPVRDSIDFLFALLITKYGLLVHEYLWMSDHSHVVLTDPRGKLSAFLRDFDSRLSKQLNAMRGTTGSNFARDPSIIATADAGAVIKEAVYTLCNAVKAGLVERLRDWKGSSSLNLRYGQTVTFARPRVGMWAETRSTKVVDGKHTSRGRLKHRGRSKTPQAASLTLVRPDIERKLSDDELRDQVLADAEADAEQLRQTRKAEGKNVIGWRNVVTTSYRDVAASPRANFQTRPRVAATDDAARDELLAKIESFERRYRAAVKEFKTNRKVVFPYGTLQMVERHGVRCETGPP